LVLPCLSALGVLIIALPAACLFSVAPAIGSLLALRRFILEAMTAGRSRADSQRQD
jgi:hypothetical protein